MPPSTIPSTFNATWSPNPPCGYSAPKRLLTGKAPSQPHDPDQFFALKCVRVIIAVTMPPPAMFTPIFAVARTVGWVAHWNEMVSDPETRLFRPRQLYAGPVERSPAPIAERKAHAPLVG